MTTAALSADSLAPIAPPPSRLPNVGTTIFTVMSALAVEKQARASQISIATRASSMRYPMPCAPA